MAFHIGVRSGVLTALLLAAGCMSGESSGNNSELGADPGAGQASGTTTGTSTSNLFAVTNLTADQSGAATNVLPSLVNAWGIAAFNGAFWIADNATGKVSVVDGAGKATKLSDTIDLGEGITGVTTNDSTAMQISGEGTSCGPANLIFASEHGKLIGINTDITATGVTLVDRSSVMADYTGVATLDMPGAKGGTQSVLTLAADFYNARIDVFDEGFHLLTTPAFTVTGLPAGFAPFNIMVANSVVYVTYAKQNADKDDSVAGAGLGFVAAFDTTCKLMWTAKGTALNAPWGMALSTDTTALVQGSLLVGNFGDGHITQLNPKDGTITGQLMTASNAAVTIDGLWGIADGTRVTGAKANAVYFAAGPAEEAHGMIGVITAAAATTPPPTTGM